LTGALAILGLGLVFALDRFAVRLVRPLPRPPERTFEERGVPFELLGIPSDGRTLAATAPTPEGGDPEGPLLVLAHGWGANMRTVLRLGAQLFRAGRQTLLFDVRGHGLNPPEPYVTVREFSLDIAAAVEFARGRWPDRKIVLVGHSIGGAGSVVAIANGLRVDGLVLIAAPSDVVRVTAEFLDFKGLPGSLISILVRPFWWLRLRGSFRALTPWRRIAEVRCPIRIIRAETDPRVEVHHAEQLAGTAGLDVEVIEGTGHNDVLDAPKTLAVVEDFLATL
jgi:pimeloyl-ACP methyl ester carboxylesterase